MSPRTAPPAQRVAVVTGAGRGLGRTIAHRLASRDIALGVLARNREQLEETSMSISAAGGRALPVAADLTEWTQVADAFDRVEAELGPVGLLVNNAGTCQAIGASWELDPDQWWADIAGNLRTTYLCTRAVLPGMIARRSGHIVNLGSESGVAHPAVAPLSRSDRSPAMTAYGTSKAAVHQFTAQLALELDGSGVTVVAIRPGPVRTAMTDAIAERLGLAPESWLPWVDEGQGAAELVWRIAEGEADGLSGRYIRSADELAGGGSVPAEANR